MYRSALKVVHGRPDHVEPPPLGSFLSIKHTPTP